MVCKTIKHHSNHIMKKLENKCNFRFCHYTLLHYIKQITVIVIILVKLSFSEVLKFANIFL